MLNGVDLEAMDSRRMFNCLMQMFVEDGMDEYGEHRSTQRGVIMSEFGEHATTRAYNETESYGRSNDTHGGATSAPLPYIPPTAQTEDGYIGLMPPLA